MDPLSRLEDMLSDFRPLFKHNNFNHFRTFVNGNLINTPYRGTMTQIYLSTQSVFLLMDFGFATFGRGHHPTL